MENLDYSTLSDRMTMVASGLETPQEVRVFEAIHKILEQLGEDANRDGLLQTPARVARAWCRELFSGYAFDPKQIVTVFENGEYDEVILLKDIEFVSTCEHHMMPFMGKGHIAYIPDGKKVIGISKLARILDGYSRRLQIQERLTKQITDALTDILQPKGAACILEAAHTCMSCRGVMKQHSKMVTSSLTGVFRDKPEARMELLQLIKGE